MATLIVALDSENEKPSRDVQQSSSILSADVDVENLGAVFGNVFIHDERSRTTSMTRIGAAC